MKIDVKNFFVALVVPEIYVREKHKFQKQLDVFFCYSLHVHAVKICISECKKAIQEHFAR